MSLWLVSSSSVTLQVLESIRIADHSGWTHKQNVSSSMLSSVWADHRTMPWLTTGMCAVRELLSEFRVCTHQNHLWDWPNICAVCELLSSFWAVQNTNENDWTCVQLVSCSLAFEQKWERQDWLNTFSRLWVASPVFERIRTFDVNNWTHI